MIKRRMTSDEMVVMHIVWNEETFSNFKELTEMVNRTYAFVWNHPRTALVLGHLVGWGYLEAEKTASGWAFVPQITRREYNRQMREYYLKHVKSQSAAFTNVEHLTEEDVKRIRKLINELE